MHDHVTTCVEECWLTLYIHAILGLEHTHTYTRSLSLSLNGDHRVRSGFNTRIVGKYNWYTLSPRQFRYLARGCVSRGARGSHHAFFSFPLAESGAFIASTRLLSTMSVKRSSTQSETPSRISRRSSAAGTASILKPRAISNASLISNFSNATTVTPQNVNGSETYSNGNPASIRAKRMSTSIPALSSIRRQSVPVHGFTSNSHSTPLISSPVISALPRVIPPTRRTSTAPKAPPSVAGSARTARSNNNPLRTIDPDSQSATPVPPSTPRRVQSLVLSAERSPIGESLGSGLSTSSPSISLTTPSLQSKKVKSSPRQSSPQVIHAESPPRTSAATSQVNGKSSTKRNGSSRSTISLSTPPSQPDFPRLNGDEDFTGAMSIWDGDDMTMDMVTEANDQDVDEEVSTYQPRYRLTSMRTCLKVSKRP